MLDNHLLAAFVVFAVVGFFTPGPNNVMLMTSGVNYGFRRTLPHVAGVTLGFAFMVAIVGVGLGAVFATWPVLQTILKYAGAAYLIYLAITIALSGPPESGDTPQGRPLTFWQAALFQWINAKGWVIAVGTVTAYAAVASYPLNIIIQIVVLVAIGAASTVTWTLFGTSLRPILKSPRAVRVFNIVMGVLLLASLYPVLVDA